MANTYQIGTIQPGNQLQVTTMDRTRLPFTVMKVQDGHLHVQREVSTGIYRNGVIPETQVYENEPGQYVVLSRTRLALDMREAKARRSSDAVLDDIVA